MEQPKTLTVPQAGREYFDLGRNASLRGSAARGHSDHSHRSIVPRAGGGLGTEARGGGEGMRSKRATSPLLGLRPG